MAKTGLNGVYALPWPFAGGQEFSFAHPSKPRLGRSPVGRAFTCHRPHYLICGPGLSPNPVAIKLLMGLSLACHASHAEIGAWV